jgi:hypothetical protein
LSLYDMNFRSLSEVLGDAFREGGFEISD